MRTVPFEALQPLDIALLLLIVAAILVGLWAHTSITRRNREAGRRFWFFNPLATVEGKVGRQTMIWWAAFAVAMGAALLLTSTK